MSNTRLEHKECRATPEQMVDMVVAAHREGEAALHATLGAFPVPTYITDADGWITAYNHACIGFAGRTPVPGEDRWCVTWKLHGLDGAPMPHEDCPMAVAVKEKRSVRGAVAAAERPDGTRRMFLPFPTPLLGEDGTLAGAVNVLIDVTDDRQACALRARAIRCRSLAQTMTDPQTVDALLSMAAECDAKAQSLRPAE